VYLYGTLSGQSASGMVPIDMIYFHVSYLNMLLCLYCCGAVLFCRGAMLLSGVS
jgi:hypothetical protein